MAPERIGGYRIESMLGSGGMSVAYRAIQLFLNCVAPMILASMLEGDFITVERSLQEATVC